MVDGSELCFAALSYQLSAVSYGQEDRVGAGGNGSGRQVSELKADG
jgi:hypothetical protein